MMKKKLPVILLDLGVIIAGAAAWFLTGWMLGALPDCPAARMGWLCPACGGTRCVRYFFSGEFGMAFAANPFIFLLIWYLGVALVLLNIGVLLKEKWAERLALRMTGWQAVIVAAVLFAVFGIVRNLW